MIVNGVETVLPDGATVADAVLVLTGREDQRGIAVARNGTVVPRTAWADTVLAAGDRLEVLTATQGG
jgi:sulfur carrier protein